MATTAEPRPVIAGPVTTAPADARITATAFLTHAAAEGPSELVHGAVRILAPAGGRHAGIARNIFVAIHTYVTPRGLGEVFTDGAGFALPHRDDTVRSPDAAFVRAGRLPVDELPDGWLALAPDLAVEVLSPSERHSEVMEKLDDYFAGGTTLAWVVDPRRRGVEVHTADRVVRWVAYRDTLDGAPVLPEFSIPVTNLFVGAVRVN